VLPALGVIQTARTCQFPVNARRAIAATFGIRAHGATITGKAFSGKGGRLRAGCSGGGGLHWGVSSFFPVSRYKFTCALTGLCCLTSNGAAIVDAAHIESWAGSQNDDLENGLSLCKNAHWMFDEGLWSVGDDGRVVLAPHRFTENGPEGLRLQPYAARLLEFSGGVTLRPNQEYFARHLGFHGFR
jgi:HNH endonuclease